MCGNRSVIPIFKNGDGNVENYGPIAIISNLAKVFESILATNLYSHVSTQISSGEHGFMQGRSATTNVCEFAQYVSSAFAS